VAIESDEENILLGGGGRCTSTEQFAPREAIDCESPAPEPGERRAFQQLPGGIKQISMGLEFNVETGA
jgi:hypothetical protein